MTGYCHVFKFLRLVFSVFRVKFPFSDFFGVVWLMHEAYDFQARRNFELDLLLVVLWPRPYNDHPEERNELHGVVERLP